ncbi:MAG: hypothetical protein HN350_14825 [Phycisphaerales bacterium]|jgi:hypothetical protein|nr:hypothetical protein [Phycisphaerales bacterium]
MANPTETTLTTSAAAALSGTSDSGTGAAFCTIGQAEYYTSDYRKEAINNRILACVNKLRAVKDGDATFGVWAGEFADGASIIAYAGSSTNALTADATNYIYLTRLGVLTVNTTGFPTDSPHVPLATILTDASGEFDFADITDYRARAIFSTVGQKTKTVSQVLDFDDFTDNGDATGYIDFTTDDIPAGSIVTGWKAVPTAGFTGDTTAVIEVGTAADPDAFSADTSQSVLAAATVGSGAAPDTAFVGAATTPRVTVTGAADFTSISAGSMTVTVYYKELD